MKVAYAALKRLLDILIASTGVVVLLPVLLLISILIKLDSPGRVIFSQQRFGKNKHLFTMYKFRTMYAEAPKDTPTHLLKNASMHITKLGSFLRKTSLDELPQLCNVIKGNMSIIGPRPALYTQHDLVAERDKYGVNSLRPGISGWAQVNGRDELSIAAKVQYDVAYMTKFGLAMDVKCLIETLRAVAHRRGIKEGDGNTDA